MNLLRSFLLKGMPDHPLQQTGLLILRLAVGMPLALNHGWGTFTALLSEGGGNYPDPVGLGSSLSMALMSFSEFFCALAISLGILTRLAAVPLIFGFAVAVFVYHNGDAFGQKELAWLYLSFCTALVFTGPGRYSLDFFLIKKQQR